MEGAIMILDSKKLTGKAKELEENLNKVVIGQEEAIRELSIATQRYYYGLCDSSKPISNLFFAGRSGCGKTKVAEELAKFFGVSLMKVNCAEYQISHEISKLIGSPPGYLGHSETKAFFNKKDVETPSPNVILFDEIEKAADSLFHLLLSITDKGELKLGNNEIVSFRNCFIIMTSNIGVDLIEKQIKSIGFVKKTVDRKDEVNSLNKAMKVKFRPEFINRLDKVIKFKNLTKDDARKILELELSKIQYRIMNSEINKKKVFFVLNDETKEWLVNKGYSDEYGARFMTKVLSKEIELPLACCIGNDVVCDGDVIELNYNKEKDELDFIKSKLNRSKSRTLKVTF